MATNTAGTVARELSFQAVHYLRKQIDEVSGTTISVGTIPAGSVILAGCSGTYVDTIFSGGNPSVALGVTGDTSRFGTADLDAAATFVVLSDLTDLIVGTSPIEILATITLDTPGAADGIAEIIIAYCPAI